MIWSIGEVANRVICEVAQESIVWSGAIFVMKFWSVTKKCDGIKKVRKQGNTDGTSDIGDYVNSILDNSLSIFSFRGCLSELHPWNKITIQVPAWDDFS